MAAAFAELVRELKTLRKGRGLLVGQIGERIGPALRAACGVADGDGPAEIRRKVAGRLESLASGLPEDLRVAAMAAFAIDRDARLPFYQERVRWAAERLRRDDRTARRRIDEAIDRIAELAASSDALTLEMSTTGWHTDKLRISLVLDQVVPEVFELRRVVADRDGLSELELAMTLTAGPKRDQPVGVDELEVDVFYGGRLLRKTMETTDRFGLFLALPRPLRRDETHDFALRYRMADGEIRSLYVCVPKHRCDLFELRVRFNLNGLPAHIWRLSDVFHHDVDGPVPTRELLTPDAAGEVHTIFRQLTPGLAYGVRWVPESTGAADPATRGGA
jgi:hypothetical protein